MYSRISRLGQSLRGRSAYAFPSSLSPPSPPPPPNGELCVACQPPRTRRTSIDGLIDSSRRTTAVRQPDLRERDRVSLLLSVCAHVSAQNLFCDLELAQCQQTVIHLLFFSTRLLLVDGLHVNATPFTTPRSLARHFTITKFPKLDCTAQWTVQTNQTLTSSSSSSSARLDSSILFFY